MMCIMMHYATTLPEAPNAGVTGCSLLCHEEFNY